MVGFCFVLDLVGRQCADAVEESEKVESYPNHWYLALSHLKPMHGDHKESFGIDSQKIARQKFGRSGMWQAPLLQELEYKPPGQSMSPLVLSDRQGVRLFQLGYQEYLSVGLWTCSLEVSPELFELLLPTNLVEMMVWYSVMNRGRCGNCVVLLDRQLAAHPSHTWYLSNNVQTCHLAFSHQQLSALRQNRNLPGPVVLTYHLPVSGSSTHELSAFAFCCHDVSAIVGNSPRWSEIR